MDISAFRVCASVEVRELIEQTLGDAVSMAAMPHAQRCAEWREELFQRVAAQDAYMYVPFRFDCGVTKPLGVYWADVCGAGVAFGHQFMLPQERGAWQAVGALKACAKALLHDFGELQVLMGLTPEENHAAQAVAKRAGFRMGGYVRSNGGECALMVAERSVFEREV